MVLTTIEGGLRTLSKVDNADIIAARRVFTEAMDRREGDEDIEIALSAGFAMIFTFIDALRSGGFTEQMTAETLDQIVTQAKEAVERDMAKRPSQSN
jgi:hypothetical protein